MPQVFTTEWLCFRSLNHRLEATFSVVAESLFAMLTSNSTKRIDIVFDIYKDISIKNAERSERATGPKGITYQNILPGNEVKIGARS